MLLGEYQLQSKDILYVAVLVNALEIGTTIELHKKHDSQVQFFPLLFLSKKDAFLLTEKVHKPDHVFTMLLYIYFGDYRCRHTSNISNNFLVAELWKTGSKSFITV